MIRLRKDFTMTALRITLGLLVLERSCVFVLAGRAAGPFGHNGLFNALSLTLGWCEIVAAVLFLVPQTLVAGAYALVAVFVLAAALHIVHGEPDVGASLAVWTAAVLAVVAHRQPDRTGTPGSTEVIS